MIVFGVLAEVDHVVVAGHDRAQVIDGEKPFQRGIGRPFVALAEAVIHEQTLEQIRGLAKAIGVFVTRRVDRASDRGLKQLRSARAVERFAPQVTHEVIMQFKHELIAGIEHRVTPPICGRLRRASPRAV